MCAEREVGALAEVEFRLRVMFLDSLEEESEPESEGEEVGSDLEFDEECWEHGQIVPSDDDGQVSERPYDGALVQRGQFQSDGGEWRYEHGQAAVPSDKEDGGGQFTARPFDGALAREGGPSDGTLLLSGFEARGDGHEQGDQHELTPRDVQRLVRLAFRGGDVEGDEAYQRALASGETVSAATRAGMLDRALRSARPAPAPPSHSGMPLASGPDAHRMAVASYTTMAAEELVLLARDDKTVSLAVIPATTAPSTPASDAAEATFRLVVEQSYRCGGTDEVDTMEDVACRVPVAELRSAAAAVDRAFEELLAGLDHPTLRVEVAPEAREAAARVRARCAEEEGDRLGGVEFRLRVVFVDSFDDEEETGSDLELDEESWERGRSDEQDPAALSDDDDGGGGGGNQFSARPYDGALAREGGPSDATLLLSGFEARADGPELTDQHELTSRDLQRLVRLAFSGGDVEGDEGYQRAVDGGTPVSRVARAVMLDQGLRSARPQQQQEQQPESTRGMPPRMRTGW
ncbi:hypothetical protein BAE44_0022164 [Dichanthelium oligosanthes]|uniref:Uncharacterized protein n=1 Tax=Dichanthelium oligosanthes TaxID=888268 RepID=A0A1E5UVD3_9POAL|nr:hypothetical protein BAE44_0022164 [Dichanthelium oligosanthes]